MLIAGCGDVGAALGVQLARAGHRVWGLRRRPAGLPGDITPLAADLADPASLRNLPDGVDRVVYTAAAGGYDDGAYRRAYVDGVYNLLDALVAAGRPPERFVFASSTSVYGQSGGEWVDETSQTEPTGFAGRRMLEGEQAARSGPCAAVAVRFGGIYGPGRLRLLRRVVDGGECVDAPPVYTNRIHRDDCAGVLAHLAFLEQPEPVYLAVDDEPAPECEVMDWLAARLGVAAPGRRGQGGALPARGNKRCRNARLRASGYAFRYPGYRAGYGALADAFRAGRGPG